jgi:hypothetical protein
VSAASGALARSVGSMDCDMTHLEACVDAGAAEGLSARAVGFVEARLEDQFNATPAVGGGGETGSGSETATGSSGEGCVSDSLQWKGA